MFSYAQTPQSIKQSISQSFKLYTFSFKKIFLWSVVVASFNPLLTALWLQVDLNSAVMPVLIKVCNLMGYSFLILLVNREATQNRVLPRMNSSKLLKKICFVLIGAAISCLVYLLMTFIIGFVAGFVVGFLNSILHADIATSFQNSLIILLVKIFLVYAVPYFILLICIILFEESGILKSFQQSFVLIHKNWWRTFFLLLIVIFIITTFAGLIDFSLYALGYIEKNGLEWTEIIAFSLIASVSTPLLLSFILIIFNDLKNRKKLIIH